MLATDSTWAIVITTQGFYIGCTRITPHALELAVRNREFVTYDPVYELFSSIMAGPKGLQRTVLALPFMYTNLGAPLTLQAQGIQLFRDMKEKDVARYKNLVAVAERQMEALRANDCGIALTDKMPKQ